MQINIEQILLLLHLLGAVSVGILIIAAGFALVTRKSHFYKSFALLIALGAGFQLVSGSLFAISVQSNESLLAFCSKIGIYLTVIGIIEALLFSRLQAEKQNTFPARIVASSLMFGMSFVIFTTIILYAK
jgi:hypothetical protein